RSIFQRSCHQNHIPVEVETRLGKIRGQESIFLYKRVRSFLSVPYAEPPTGQQRFRPPKPKKPWNETVVANTLSPACYQGRDTYNTSFWGSEMWNHNTPVSEDCLFLNIWTPGEAYNLTVMVWLFGGGYYSGSPSLILYDGKALALLGNVIVVNVNYRVGPFGYLFMDDDEAPGNVGMLDQQLALYWIRDNIFNFGGNPSRITLFGESAGASSIVAHLIAPGSENLFKNGILQSGSLDNEWSMDTPSRGLDKSKQLANLVGCNRTKVKEMIACLRSAPAQLLVDNIWNLNLGFVEDRNFFRHKDGFTSLRNGEYVHHVNLMIGINHDEGNFWNIYNLANYFDKTEQPKLNRNEFHDCIERAFASQPELVRSAAKHIYSDPNCTDPNKKTQFYAEQVNQMVGDYFFTCDSIWLADQISQYDGQHGRVYIYYFDQPSRTLNQPMFGLNITLSTTRARDYHRWMLLKGGSHLKPINARKKVECDLWRHAKDIEYNSYGMCVTIHCKKLSYDFRLSVFVNSSG
uniref:Carboxylic ester hydrolase n=1 Tax=Angiostrongylus cantonensis TaxID=6313 RepID=A0A158P9F5_ANGCA